MFNPFNWWSVEDLRAEIREESSNNRIKSGYDERTDSPIDKVPDAGAYEVSSTPTAKAGLLTTSGVTQCPRPRRL